MGKVKRDYRILNIKLSMRVLWEILRRISLLSWGVVYPHNVSQ